MSEICENCKHALPVDPKGTWRHRAGSENWPDTHIHCSLFDYPRTRVIHKRVGCAHCPSKWEERETRFDYHSG
jgi:hypothetical protein